MIFCRLPNRKYQKLDIVGALFGKRPGGNDKGRVEIFIRFSKNRLYRRIVAFGPRLDLVHGRKIWAFDFHIANREGAPFMQRDDPKLARYPEELVALNDSAVDDEILIFVKPDFSHRWCGVHMRPHTHTASITNAIAR